MTRYGNIRSISFQGLNRTHTEDEVLATLPVGDRPTNRTFVSGNIGTNSVVISLTPNGELTIYSLNGVTASARVYFGMTYIVP